MRSSLWWPQKFKFQNNIVWQTVNHIIGKPGLNVDMSLFCKNAKIRKVTIWHTKFSHKVLYFLFLSQCNKLDLWNLKYPNAYVKSKTFSFWANIFKGPILWCRKCVVKTILRSTTKSLALCNDSNRPSLSQNKHL